MKQEIELLVLLARLEIDEKIYRQILNLLKRDLKWEYITYQCIQNKICNIVYRNIEKYNLENYFNYNTLKIFRYYYNYSIQRLMHLEKKC